MVRSESYSSLAGTDFELSQFREGGPPRSPSPRLAVPATRPELAALLRSASTKSFIRASDSGTDVRSRGGESYFSAWLQRELQRDGEPSKMGVVARVLCLRHPLYSLAPFLA